MPELQMDCPTIYRLLFDNVIVPLENILDMKKLKWVDTSKKPAKEKEKDDSDEYIIEDTDSQFKLAAMLLADKKKKSKSWDEVIKWYETELAWKKIFMEKYDKIDEKEATFKEIADVVGAEAASVITLLLDQDPSDSKKNKAKL